MVADEQLLSSLEGRCNLGSNHFDKTAGHRFSDVAACQQSPAANNPGLPSDWFIKSQPCSYDEQAELALHHMLFFDYGSQQLQLNIKPSLSWTMDDLSTLNSLVQDRNRFVCMQLVTMAKEQYAKVQEAVAAGNGNSQLQARFTFLAMLRVGQALPESAGMNLPHQVVAAALFYPRAEGKDGLDRQPHMYVELICCNQPGRGYGTLLLQHIEQFVTSGCECISAGFLGSQAAAAAAAALPPVVGKAQPAVGERGEGDIATGAQNSCTAGSTGQRKAQCGMSAAGMVAAAEGGCNLLLDINSNHSAHCLWPATQVDDVASQVDAASHHETPAIVMGTKAAERMAARICGIRLLSVESAQAFYTKMGYSAPDPVCREMFKSLPASSAAT